MFQKNYDQNQFLRKKWSKFQQNSRKLCNEALIGKTCRNKSWRKLNLTSENVNIKYVCMSVFQKNDGLCQFLVENGPNFNKNATKLRNEALIGKKCRSKSWRKLNLGSENVNIEYVCMLVCQKNYVLWDFDHISIYMWFYGVYLLNYAFLWKIIGILFCSESNFDPKKV